jgi:hypothetical protein
LLPSGNHLPLCNESGKKLPPSKQLSGRLRKALEKKRNKCRCFGGQVSGYEALSL